MGNHRFDRIIEPLDVSPQNLTDLLDRRPLCDFFRGNDHADVLTIDVGKVGDHNGPIVNDDVIDLVH